VSPITARAWFFVWHLHNGRPDLARMVLLAPDWWLWPLDLVIQRKLKV